MLTMTFKKLIADEQGVTALEYALLASLISVVVITAIQSVGLNARNVFFNVASAIRVPS